MNANSTQFLQTPAIFMVDEDVFFAPMPVQQSMTNSTSVAWSMDVPIIGASFHRRTYTRWFSSLSESVLLTARAYGFSGSLVELYIRFRLAPASETYPQRKGM